MTLNNQFMAFNDPNKQLHDCIYGGPIPTEQLLARLNDAGIQFPLMTTVLREGTEKPNWNSWDFKPGDGWIYRTMSLRAGLDHTWRRAQTPKEWQRSLQARLIELRRSPQSHNAPQPSPELEAHSRQLALFQFTHSQPNWREAVAYWQSAVVLRTRAKIHDAHRALLAFLLDAAAPLPSIGEVGHRFHTTMQQLLATYTVDGLIHLQMQGLEIVQEKLVQHNQRLDTKMQQALKYIHLNLSNSFTLDDVANAIQMTPAAFSRKFKTAIGQTYTNYLQSIRIEQALPLLLRSDRSILEVAQEAGFGSVEQFHRVFKARLGVTPLNYRLGKIPEQTKERGECL